MTSAIIKTLFFLSFNVCLLWCDDGGSNDGGVVVVNDGLDTLGHEESVNTVTTTTATSISIAATTDKAVATDDHVVLLEKNGDNDILYPDTMSSTMVKM